MRRDKIIEIQNEIGTAPDGFWGPKSTIACQRYLYNLMRQRYDLEGENKPPLPDDASMKAYYGQPGSTSNLVSIGVGDFGMQYDHKSVLTVRVHERAAESLHGALKEISESPSSRILDYYAGTFNNRPMRGGSRPSKHAWGVAIDLDPDSNGLRQHWPMSADMPFEVIRIFAKWGWTSAGAFWSRDAMHFERTRPY
jgi:hypothetical protein